STVTLSQPHCAITSAENPEGIASHPFTAALPAFHRSFSLFSAMPHPLRFRKIPCAVAIACRWRRGQPSKTLPGETAGTLWEGGVEPRQRAAKLNLRSGGPPESQLDPPGVLDRGDLLPAGRRRVSR